MKLAEEQNKQLVQEFEGKILPENHVVTRHVRRVLTRLLEANNLGTLSGPTNGMDQASGWSTMSANDVETTREWNLIVVNDDSIVNAAATYGKHPSILYRFHEMSNSGRECCGIHWHPSCLS